MIGRPDPDEAAPYYFNYINRVPGGDLLGFLDAQTRALVAELEAVSEDHSLLRYEPGKWSLRELLGHMTDTERVFAFRALWLARGSEPALPGFDQDVFAANAGAGIRSWESLIQEFKTVRSATVSLLGSLPPEAWRRTGSVSGHSASTRAIAYMIAGHVEHHREVIAARYHQK